MIGTLKYEDIKKMDVKAIDEKISASRKEIFRLKMQKGTSGLEKPSQLKDYKKDIARLMTAKTAINKG